MTQRIEDLTPEVMVVREPLVTVGPAEVELLGERLPASDRRRVRLCAHQDTGARLQEMFILLDQATWIRPHLHTGKIESLHVVAGEADAVFFDTRGEVIRVLPLGPPPSGKCFYYRLEEPVHHTLLLLTPTFLFHEVTSGPFLREETLFPEWAPGEEDPGACRRYREELVRRVDEHRRRGGG